MPDLGGGARDAPQVSKFFRFHAVFGKFWQNRMLAPPRSCRPLLGEILDPPLPSDSWLLDNLDIFLQLIYTVGTGAELYIDNVLKASVYEAQPRTNNSPADGRIVLGRYVVDRVRNVDNYGRAETDYLTIWDKPLSRDERDLLHQN